MSAMEEKDKKNTFAVQMEGFSFFFQIFVDFRWNHMD